MKIYIKNLFKNKVQIKVFSYTILILAIAFFSSFPSSNSKYIKETDFATALNYNNSFINLNSSSLGSKNINYNSKTSTIETIDVTFTFDRNNITRSGETDIYTIVIPNSCSISKISSSNKSDEINQSSKTIKLSHQEASTITTNMKCDVNSLTKNDTISIPISIEEKIEEDFASFTYLKSTYTISLANYLKSIPLPSTSSLKISKKSTSIYEELKTALQTYYFPGYINNIYSSGTATTMREAIINNNHENEYIYYFNNINTSNLIATLQKDSNGKYYSDKVPGILIDIDSDKDNYIFEIQENFIGYALTYTKNNKNMYFTYSDSNENKANFINSIFYEYLKHFYSNDADYNAISSYLEKELKGSTIGEYILSNQSNIIGISSKSEKNYIVTYASGLLNATKITNESPIILDSSVISRELYNNFISQFNSCVETGECKNLNLFKNVKTVITENQSIANSYRKNSANGANKFIDYFVIDGTDPASSNKHQYVIVHIQSDGQAQDGVVYTYIDFKVIEAPEKVTISAAMKNDVSKTLSITYNDINNLTEEETRQLADDIRMTHATFGITLTEEEILSKIDTAKEKGSLIYEITPIAPSEGVYAGTKPTLEFLTATS